MNVVEIAKYVGRPDCTVLFDGLHFPVRVIDGRPGFGRVDFLVASVGDFAGGNPIWIAYSTKGKLTGRLKFHNDPEPALGAAPAFAAAGGVS